MSSPEISPTSIAPLDLLEHITDVHCHPTDSPISPETIAALSISICAMATQPSDQSLVRDLALASPEKVIPSFGYHPWFTHWIAIEPYSSKEEHYKSLFLASSSNPNHVEAFQRLLPLLPDPIPLAEILAELRRNLMAFPRAMVGEVGLDRACRIPYEAPTPPPYTDEGDRRRELSPFTIPLSHQLTILEAQLELAVELKRNVSFHSVKCQQATAELLDRMEKKHGLNWLAISVDMHSCGLSVQMWKDIERKHPNVFLSLSTVINLRSPAHTSLIAACAPDRILVESDYHDIRFVAQQTWEMLQIVAAHKGWHVEDSWVDANGDRVKRWGAVRRLEENWKIFERGNHAPRKSNKRKRGGFP